MKTLLTILFLTLSAHAVTIGGQARPIDLFTLPRTVYVTVTDMTDGQTVIVRANPFGFYRVTGLKSDRTYKLVPTAPKSHVAFEPQWFEYANPADGGEVDFVYSTYGACLLAPCG